MISDNELEAFKATKGNGFFYFSWRSEREEETHRKELENERLRLENERLKLMIEASQLKKVNYDGKEKNLPKPALARLLAFE